MRYRQHGALKIPLVPIHAPGFLSRFSRISRSRNSSSSLCVLGDLFGYFFFSSPSAEKARRVLTTKNTEGTKEIIRGRRNINVSLLLHNKLAKRSRLACEVTLHATASVFDQEVHLLRRLNAFGDRFKFQRGGDVKRQTHDLS